MLVFAGICADNLPYEKVGENEPVCIADEVPFDIPDSWEWVRLGSVGEWGSGATPSRTNPEYYNGNIPWLKTGDLNDSYIDSIPETISELALQKTSVRLNPVGSVLIAMYGATIGKLGILSIPATTNQACCACFPFSNIYNIYLFYYLMSQKTAFIKQGEGGAQPNISKEKIVNTLMPVPPLNEQHRIAKQIICLLSFVAEYDKAQTAVATLNRSFPERLKKSILQDAVQGKLVPQDPADEPASVLLERIRAEKQRLIKEGKIKKDKHESVIYRRDNSHYEKCDGVEVCIDDVLPIDIPDGWQWVRLSDLVVKEIRRGKSPTYVPHSGVMVFAQKCNVKAGGINMGLAQYLDESTLKKYPVEEYLFDGDIVINSTGNGTLGRIGVFHDSDRIDDSIIVADSHVTVIRLTDKLCFEYVLYALKYYQPYLEKQGSGSTNQTELKPMAIAKLYIPLPPFEEQKRIASMISASINRVCAL